MLQLTQNLMTSLFLTDKLTVLTELYLYNYVRLADKKSNDWKYVYMYGTVLYGFARGSQFYT